MSLEGITKDSYGYEFALTWIDPDTNEAGDLSGYTTGQSIEYKDPSGNVTTETGTFETDGSDGIVKDAAVAEGTIDEAGTWYARIKVESGSSVMYSRWKSFDVQA